MFIISKWYVSSSTYQSNTHTNSHHVFPFSLLKPIDKLWKSTARVTPTTFQRRKCSLRYIFNFRRWTESCKYNIRFNIPYVISNCRRQYFSRTRKTRDVTDPYSEVAIHARSTNKMIWFQLTWSTGQTVPLSRMDASLNTHPVCVAENTQSRNRINTQLEYGLRWEVQLYTFR